MVQPSSGGRGLFPEGFHALCEEGQLCPGMGSCSLLTHGLPRCCLNAGALCVLPTRGFGVSGLVGAK